MGTVSNLPTDKGGPERLLSDLAFCLFGHEDAFLRTKGKPDEVAKAYAERVISVLEYLHTQIQSENFDKRKYGFIDEQYLAEYFQGKKFNYVKQSLIKNKVDFKSKRNKRQRGEYLAMLTILRDIFQWDVDHEILQYLRKLVGYEIGPGSGVDVSLQVKTLNQILNVIEDFTNKNPPDWSITYDGSYNRPIIKSDQTGRFLSATEARKDGKILEGRYTVFRKAFSPPDLQRVYARESLNVRLRSYGAIFDLQTRNAQRSDSSKFQGIALFLDGGFWLIGHTRDIYARMRIMAGSTDDWRKLKLSEDVNFASISIQAHVKRDNITETMHRVGVCKLQKKDNPRAPFFDGAEFITRAELAKYLSEDEIQQIPD